MADDHRLKKLHIVFTPETVTGHQEANQWIDVYGTITSISYPGEPPLVSFAHCPAMRRGVQELIGVQPVTPCCGAIHTFVDDFMTPRCSRCGDFLASSDLDPFGMSDDDFISLLTAPLNLDPFELVIVLSALQARLAKLNAFTAPFLDQHVRDAEEIALFEQRVRRLSGALLDD